MNKMSTKKEVDRHVKQSLSKLSEKEKNLRGYVVAKLYYKVGDFASAQHWLSSYLTEKEEHPDAHKLLGQCFEKLNKPDRAITEYQRSLQLNSKQTGLIAEVCRLMLSDNQLASNSSKAKYWCDLADSNNLKDDVVLNLKLKLLNKDKGQDNNQAEEMILKEITSRPMDIGLRIRLINFKLEEKKIQEAFQYCYEIEMKFLENFQQSIEWCSAVGQVLAQQTNRDNWNFWCLLILNQERQIYLNLKKDLALYSNKQNSVKEITNSLFDFDQSLLKASDMLLVLSPEKEMVTDFLCHFRGQLCLHVASLLLQKQKVSNSNQWRDAVKKSLPLLMFAYLAGTANDANFWLKNTNDKTRALFSYLRKEGAFRCAQAARTILSCIQYENDDPLIAQIRQVTNKKSWNSMDDLINQSKQICADSNWKKSIFRELFTNSDQQSKVSSSFFVQCPQLNEPSYDGLLFENLPSLEEEAQLLYPSSLEHQVYLGLGRSSLSDFKNQSFQNLNLSTSNLVNCNPETLNQIDIDSFLYCSVLQAKRNMEAERQVQEQFNNKPSNKPLILPAPLLLEGLCTEEQKDWWISAWKIYKNISGENLAQLKAILQFGIEAVRGVDIPKIDLILLLKLGDILLKRSKIIDRSEEKKHLELRVEQIYKFALKMIRNKDHDNLRRVFKFATINYDVEREVNRLAEEAITHLAGVYFKREEYKELIEDFAGLKLPFASYFQAEAYRRLDDCSKTPKKAKKIYIEKTKDHLQESLGLLEMNPENKNHRLHGLIQSELKRLQFNNSSMGEDLLEASTTGEEDLFQDAYSSPFRIRRGDTSYLNNRSSEIENLIKKLIDSLDLVKDDVLSIRNDVTDIKDKLEKVEENLAKKSSTSDVALNDMYMLDELNPNNYMGSNFMYDARTQTPVQVGAAAAAAALQTPQQRVSQQAAAYNHAFNTAYPMYMQQYSAAQNAQLQGLRAQSKLPGFASPLNYGEPLNEFQANLMMAQQNGYFPQLGVFPGVTGTPQQNLLPQQNQNAQTPKSSLLEALSTPSLLSTWNNTYNNQTPQINQAPLPQVQIPQPQAVQQPPVLVEKQPPVNVVITSSDPLPTHTTTFTQPALSVTIPPQHIKHQVVQPPVVPPTSQQIQSSFNDSSLNKSANVYENVTPPNKTNDDSLVEPEDYDPCPNFKPIIPLPDEIEVKTGEENEEEMFCERAKLFRFTDKEWKERGIGNMKILKNPQDHKVRILMRREQIHKICANHQITVDMNLTAANEKSFIWIAPDFSEKEMVWEKFLLRFKTAELAKKFSDKFEEAKSYLGTKANQTGFGAKIDIKEAEKPAPPTFGFGSEKKPLTFGASASPAQISFGSVSQQVSITPVKAQEPTISFGSSTPIQNKPETISKPFSFASVAAGDSKASPLFDFKPKEAAVPENKEPAKPSPFANFSFGKTSLDSISKPFSNLFNSSPGTVPAATTTPDTTVNKSANESHEDDEYEPNVTFEPVIPLPELVDTKTGEENEDIAFEHRAKLLRYDPSTKEWKERGIGNMKVLVDKNDPSKARLLMRREQVLKLCCNQLINQELKFTKLPKSETALSWAGPDFSENEMKTETLAIRFKTAQLCQEFHQAVIKVQETMKNSGTKKAPATEKKEEAPPATKGFGDQFKPKAGSWDCEACYINNKPDVLYCVACDSPKDNTVPKKEPKGLLDTSSGAKFSFGMPAVGAGTVSSAEPQKFSFGNPTATPATAPSGFTFGNLATASTTTASGFTFGSAPTVTTTTASAPKSGFSFGTPATTTITAVQPDTTPKIGFGTPNPAPPAASSFSFNSLALNKPDSTTSATVTETITNEAETASAPFSFQSPKKSDAIQKDTFNFVFKPKSPSAKSPGRSANNSVSEDVASDNEYHVDEENNTYFTPVIPLPEKIDVKTGEEDEDVLYSHRAKLFRFIENEWKERGLGDVKILKHKTSGKLRVVMRRETIFKICLNHVLSKEINYKKKDDKSWLFFANDYSEGNVEVTQFCIRFKNTEIAKEFKEAIDKALASDGKVEVGGDADNGAKELERLKLPSNFYDYKTAKECPGCRGCKSDEFVFPVYSNQLVLDDTNTLPLEHPKLKVPIIAKNSTKNVSFQLNYENKENEKIKSLFGAAASANKPESSIFGLKKTPESTNIFAQGKPVFGESTNTNIFGTPTNPSNSIFSPSLNTIPVSTPSTADSNKSEVTTIFGGTGVKSPTAEGGNIFGGKPTFSFGQGTSIFGGALGANKDSNSTGETKPVFGSAATFVSAKSTFSFATAAKELPTAGNLAQKTEKENGTSEQTVDIPTTVTDKENEKPVPLFLNQQENAISFAALASTANPEKNFLNTSAEKTGNSGFFGLTIKEDIFSKLAKQQNPDNSNDGGEHDESAGNDAYDPHYDPIISLPDEIQVSTGEEDEVKVFGERAKLFRYDVNTKEWKERGVGEIKILHHPQNETYRMLMRREQIFKLVLNQLITDDFTMKLMNTSGKAYCWAGMNYAEDQGVAEQLAIRFKNEDLAQQFRNKMDECVEKVKVINASNN